MLGKHLLGIYEKAMPAQLDWGRRLAMAKRLGFDFVEISIDEADERLERLYWDEEKRAVLHRQVLEQSMPFQTMCLSGHRRFPFGSADAATREKAYDIMERAVLFAREFGVRVIQLAGYDVYYEDADEVSLTRFIDGMRYACALAAQYQVMLAMEIMDTRLLSTISRYLLLKRELHSPWLTVYPDMGNLTAWGSDVPVELALGRDEIVAMHIKETLAVTDNFAGKFKCVPLGTGCVDFLSVFAALEKQGFCGPYMLEMWHQKGQDAEADIAAALAFVKQQYNAGMKTLAGK